MDGADYCIFRASRVRGYFIGLRRLEAHSSCRLLSLKLPLALGLDMECRHEIGGLGLRHCPLVNFAVRE